MPSPLNIVLFHPPTLHTSRPMSWVNVTRSDVHLEIGIDSVTRVAEEGLGVKHFRF